jgi:hypothetical protein
MSTHFQIRCDGCDRVIEGMWFRDHEFILCRTCIKNSSAPEFYSNEETLTVGLVCNDCDPPELVTSTCIEGMDLLETLHVGKQASDAWFGHRRTVHREDIP